MMSAKLKALQLVRVKGPLQPSDPNDPIQKATTPKMQAKVRKRALDTLGDEDAMEINTGLVDTPRPLKRTKAELDELLQAKSAHSNLVDEFEVKQSEQYFSKLERKEQMEAKMLDTFEIKTTAVTCTKVSKSCFVTKFLIHLVIIRLNSAIIQRYLPLNYVVEKDTQFAQLKP